MTIKIISIALSKGWKMHQVDINNPLLNDTLYKEFYISQPLALKIQCILVMFARLRRKFMA